MKTYDGFTFGEDNTLEDKTYSVIMMAKKKYLYYEGKTLFHIIITF